MFAVICAIGVAYSIGGLAGSAVGTQPWWVGILGLGLLVPVFLFIDGGWLWIQRQVEIADGTISVTRWLDVLRGRQGPAIPLDASTTVSIVTDGRRQLRIERLGVVAVDCTLLYWPPHAVRALLDAFRSAGIEVGKSWTGDYPPARFRSSRGI